MRVGPGLYFVPENTAAFQRREKKNPEKAEFWGGGGGTCKGPVVTGHSPGTAKKGSVVAGGEGAAGGQALTSSPCCPPTPFHCTEQVFPQW